MTTEHIRTWTSEDGAFRLDLWDVNRRDELGKWVLRYALYDDQWNERDGHHDRKEPDTRGTIVFEGEDFACSPMNAVDSDATVAALLGFLSLQDGDTDSDYFDSYTDRQRAWRDARAEDLSMFVLELEEAASR